MLNATDTLFIDESIIQTDKTFDVDVNYPNEYIGVYIGIFHMSNYCMLQYRIQLLDVIHAYISLLNTSSCSV